MKKFLIFLLAVSMLLGMLTGCRKDAGAEKTETSGAPTETTVPPPTVPQDGDPNDVTCKGTYSAAVDEAQVVAKAGGAELTNGLLQVFYWAEAAAYRQAEHEIAPDFSLPLDTQPCPIDETVGSWQQYFLKHALNSWHTAQALVLQGAQEGTPTEEAYKPDPEKHAEYMTGMPALKVLYGQNREYVPNSMHQAYLDNIPQMLEALAQDRGYADAAAMAGEAFGVTLENLTGYAELYNRGYMFFTTLSYELIPEEREQQDSGEKFVDIRQILLYPKYPDNPWRKEAVETAQISEDGTVTCSEELWSLGMDQAEKMLTKWKQDRFRGEGTFADLANKNSADAGSALNGGLYRHLSRGQLLPELEQWAFEPERQAGDTTILRTQYGIHILYFRGSTDGETDRENTADIIRQQQGLMTAAREKYPAEIFYSKIGLTGAQPKVSTGDLLYADVAHERYPEAPLYLQQDYPDTKYGAYPIRTHGCGITTWAMLASYMTDTEMTPPEMCARYGNYSHKNGTDGMMFNREPAENGFYLQYKTYDPEPAKQALKDGYPVVCVQTKGFWTRGGHYLLLEAIDENDQIQVRDSNIFNYGRLPDHAKDRFDWKTIPPKAVGYWIFDKKITRIPACVRCGNREDLTQSVIPADYICEKCGPAMVRRETYLNGINN